MTTREAWLEAAIDKLRPWFITNGYTVPQNVRVTCGFPSRSAMPARKQRIGECWSDTASKGKVFEIFISPFLDKPLDVAAVLAHELVHATVGLKVGHKAPFKRCAVAIGLEGRMTATKAGEKFISWFNDQVFSVYPHQRMIAKPHDKKQTTRLIKCQCGGCGYTVRTTRAWLDNAGAPICPACETQMEEQQ